MTGSHTDPEELGSGALTAEGTYGEHISCLNITVKAMQNCETPPPPSLRLNFSESLNSVPPRKTKTKRKGSFTDILRGDQRTHGCLRPTERPQVRKCGHGSNCFTQQLWSSPATEAPCISSTASPHTEGCAVRF